MTSDNVFSEWLTSLATFWIKRYIQRAKSHER